jgi:DNA-binding LacI/PurR family transcriptional regulator
MRPTLKKLAEKAGMSIGTVSRALRDDPLIAESTRRKIRGLAERMNYIPDNFGRGLQARSSRLIGLLISNIHDSFYSQSLQGIGEAATARGYGLVVGVTAGDPEKEIRQLRLFQEKRVDGIILSNYQPETVPHLRALARARLPMAVCDFETFDPAVPDVMVDDAKAMRLLAAHLTGLGHKRLAFCYCVNPNAEKRFRAAAAAAWKGGAALVVCCASRSDLEAALDSDSPPTAVMAYSDFHAADAKHAAEERGLTVPERFSVAGFDDLDFASWPEFDFTTIDQPKTELGTRTAELVFSKILGKRDVRPVRFAPKLVIRSSTAPPPGRSGAAGRRSAVVREKKERA